MHMQCTVQCAVQCSAVELHYSGVACREAAVIMELRHSNTEVVVARRGGNIGGRYEARIYSDLGNKSCLEFMHLLYQLVHWKDS